MANALRPLFYSALAPAPISAALATQANESLRPFVAYVNAAKTAAKEREARSRCQWEPVPLVQGAEARGTNPDEIAAMERVLVAWRRFATARRTDGRPWEIACLSFYNRQELAIRDMLRRLTGLPRAETRFELPNTAIACGTVDRFQGREADLARSISCGPS